MAPFSPPPHPLLPKPTDLDEAAKLVVLVSQTLGGFGVNGHGGGDKSRADAAHVFVHGRTHLFTVMRDTDT